MSKNHAKIQSAGRPVAILVLALGLMVASPAGRRARAEEPPESKPAPAPGPVEAPAPIEGLDVPLTAPAVLPAPAREYPIDLPTALRLAEVENPDIAEARTAITAALANQQAAQVILAPSLNAGASYHGHVGNLQRSSGRILNLSEQSLYIGGGARTLAAESVGIPAVNIAGHLADALFEPLAARRRVAAAESEARAVFNNTLLEVAVLHQELLAAQAVFEALQLTLGETAEVVRTTREFAQAGEGRVADADRSLTEWRLRKAEVQAAEGEVAIASARLARRLNLDPTVRLRPAGGRLEALSLVALDVPTEEYVRIAVRRRPEVAATSATIGEADAHVRQEKSRPLLPMVWLGFSGGAMGGGSNLVQNNLGNFKGRTDFDVRVFWTISNLGAGNLAMIRRRAAQRGEAVASQSMAINLIRREVSASQAEAKAARNSIDVARRQLKLASAGFLEDLERSRDGLGRPIEVLGNLNRLASARLELIQAFLDYNQQQFRLFVALGTPPPAGPPSPAAPAAPPPVTTPIRGPFHAQPH